MYFKRYLMGAAVILAIMASVLITNALLSPCLVLRDGDTGKVISFYPVKEGDEFSITFVHSVNNSPVTDIYQIRNGKLYVVRTIYYSFGAGVQTEIEDGQTLDYGPDGSMIVSGFNIPMDNLSYIVGTVSDHELEIDGQSISLRELCGRNVTVRFTCEYRFNILQSKDHG
jgi:hypothetical protein